MFPLPVVYVFADLYFSVVTILLTFVINLKEIPTNKGVNYYQIKKNENTELCAPYLVSMFSQTYNFQ